LGLVGFVWRSNYERRESGTIEDNVPTMISFRPYQEYLKSNELLWEDMWQGVGLERPWRFERFLISWTPTSPSLSLRMGQVGNLRRLVEI
jgi:hypothetical protein